MKKECGLIKSEIDSILFTDEYLMVLKDIGFSREFRLKEQLRKQRECIQFLASQIDQLRSKFNSDQEILERIA